MKRYDDYDDFAWLYNKEWGVFAENIFSALKVMAGDKLTDGAKILDLCCGTGQLAKILTEKGYKVTGLDGSKKMLRYAKENASGAEFVLGDARAFKLPQEYGAVFSTFDALNHIMTIEGLAQVFVNVFKCLVGGGIFIFDMTMKFQFEVRAKTFNHFTERQDYLFTQRGGYNEKNKIGDSHITLFQPEGKLWKRSDTILYQTWYPCEKIKSSLAQAGFTAIRAHSFNEQRELVEGTDDTDRVFFYAQKL
jgi:SAM-dependent methyltransferase